MPPPQILRLFKDPEMKWEEKAALANASVLPERKRRFGCNVCHFSPAC